jgi:hypothetical protein
MPELGEDLYEAAPILLSPVDPAVSPLAEAILSTRQAFNSAAAWPAANRAILPPVVLQRPVTATQIAWYNGATVAGNVSVGIYDQRRKQLVEARAAMSGASTVQVIDIADTLLMPGRYWPAMASDSGTATFFRATLNSFVQTLCGLRNISTAYPLPVSAFTLQDSQSSYCPFFVVLCRGAVI